MHKDTQEFPEIILLSFLCSFITSLKALFIFLVIPGFILMLYGGYGLVRDLFQWLGLVKFLIVSTIILVIVSAVPILIILIIFGLIIFNSINANYYPILYFFIGLVPFLFSFIFIDYGDPGEEVIIIYLLSAPILIVNACMYSSIVALFYYYGLSFTILYKNLGLLWTLVSVIAFPLVPLFTSLLSGNYIPFIVTFVGWIVLIISFWLSFLGNLLFLPRTFDRLKLKNSSGT